MEKKEKVSIIVPAYNAEKYIEECIISVLNQSYINIELIVVNDGSVDGTREICNKYEKVDSRMKAIYQENAGVVNARKIGVRVAEGEYIVFVDADDWLEKEAIECMYEVMKKEKVDIVAAGYIKDDTASSIKVYNEIDEGKYSTKDVRFLEDALYLFEKNRAGLEPYLCTKMFKRNVLLECIEEEDENIYYSEDMLLVWKYLLRIENVFVLKRGFYHYRQHEASCMHSPDEHFFEQINKVYIKFKCMFIKYKIWENVKKALGAWMLKNIMFGIVDKFDFGSKPNIPEYYFESNLFETGCKVILYGAGHVGKGYYTYIKNTKCVDLIAWTDINYDRDDMKMLGVCSPEDISDLNYDYILIATIYECMADDIKRALVEKGVSLNKIIWVTPKSYME